MPQPKSAMCLAFAAAVLAAPLLTTAQARPASDVAPVVLAMSALGDLAPYRTIAADTLKIVDTGDLMAARTRVKDLETAWDKGEPTLKPKDKSTWTTLDKAIDEALTALRTPNPQAAACSTTLKTLISKMDAVSKA